MPMPRAYNVVDADGHILEPLDLWDRYMDPDFRDRAPRIVKGENGKERLVIEEHTVGTAQRGIGSIGAVGARQGVVAADTMEYKDGKPGGFDPHKRIPDMDADGIDAAFLYPSLGLFSGAIHDPALAAPVCRAYNRWLADYCSPYPDRLFSVAMLGVPVAHLALFERGSRVWNVADIGKGHGCAGLDASAGRPIAVLYVVIGDFDFVDALGDCTAGSGHSCRRRGRPQWTELPL